MHNYNNRREDRRKCGKRKIKNAIYEMGRIRHRKNQLQRTESICGK